MKTFIGISFLSIMTISFFTSHKQVFVQYVNANILNEVNLQKPATSIFSNELEEIKIGSQTWSSKNLDVSTFKNGDSIQEAKTSEEWIKAGDDKTPAWCYYQNDTAFGGKYGKLYNWFAVNDARGLAPENWKIPGETDWNLLIDFVGGTNEAANVLKSNTGWLPSSEINPDKATSSSGFNALPGGNIDYGGYFNEEETKCFFWSSSKEKENGDAAMAYEFGFSENKIYKGHKLYTNGFSIRCIKK